MDKIKSGDAILCETWRGQRYIMRIVREKNKVGLGVKKLQNEQGDQTYTFTKEL
jgi:hypothetical protein